MASRITGSSFSELFTVHSLMILVAAVAAALSFNAGAWMNSLIVAFIPIPLMMVRRSVRNEQLEAQFLSKLWYAELLIIFCMSVIVIIRSVMLFP